MTSRVSAGRTSQSHPIRVDFVAPAAHGLPGRLGLTFAPGKSLRTASGWWDRDLADDLRRLTAEYGANVLVTLLEELELRQASIPGLGAAARRAGLAWHWFPIADVSTPREPEAPIPLVREIVGHLAEGETVVVHCMGGLGRAGTIAACVLAARALEPAAAIAAVRAARPGALQTPAQEAFVGRFAAAWREAGGARERAQPEHLAARRAATPASRAAARRRARTGRKG
jgi:protein-tyrosine phosphatase